MSEKWDEKVIELAKSLINCQSYSGHEDKAAEALKAYMKEAGVFDEIAEIVGVSRNNVAIRLHRIKSMDSLGPAKAAMLIVISQLIIAYVIELLGWFGVEKQPLTLRKVIGMAVAVAGVVLFKC